MMIVPIFANFAENDIHESVKFQENTRPSYQKAYSLGASASVEKDRGQDHASNTTLSAGRIQRNTLPNISFDLEESNNCQKE